MKRQIVQIAVLTASAAGAFGLGRLSVTGELFGRGVPAELRVATFEGGVLSADDVRGPLEGIGDVQHRRAAVEQLVRIRLLAQDAETAGLHRSSAFLRRYAEELARLQVEKAFEEPFKKKLPTEEEVRKFFDDNKAKLGRSERIRMAHIAFLAPAADVEARAQKRQSAEKVLLDVRKNAKDEYAFGQLAMAKSEDARSRSAAGELPFLTREEIAGRLGPEIAEAAFALSPGQIVERVLESEQGFQIVKLIAREEGSEASYEALRESIKARLTAERREKAFKEFMETRWARANVKIDEAALGRVAIAENSEKNVH
jgi:hypothetical protein